MNSLTTFTSVATALLFSSSVSWSEVLHWPSDCTCGELKIQNNTTRPLSTWLQSRGPYLFDQQEILLEPKSSTLEKICLSNKDEHKTILHLENIKDVSATWICNKKSIPAVNYLGGQQSYKKSFWGQNQFWIKNTSYQDNVISLNFLNSEAKSIHSINIKLAPFTETYWSADSLSEISGWSQVQITAAQRFTSLKANKSNFEKAQLKATSPSGLEIKSAYFVVGPRQGPGDQFVVKISDPNMIEKARLQITDPSLEKIVFGKIQWGHDRYNRNLAKKEQPLWSWSISEVTNISDLGSTSCNGFPQLLEDHLVPWMENLGHICFWNYRIKKEITP